MAMSALGKKLVRDMRRSGMQFFAIVMLCSLGTFMFAGLDGTAGWRRARSTRTLPRTTWRISGSACPARTAIPWRESVPSAE